MSKRVRPNPVLWIWYAYGGRLPQRYSEWVLHDVGARTWMLRHALRSLVQLSPGLLFLLMPGPLWIKAMALLGGVILGLWYSLAYAEFTVEHRAHKQGYPLGTARRLREEGKAKLRAEQHERYAAIYRDSEQ